MGEADLEQGHHNTRRADLEQGYHNTRRADQNQEYTNTRGSSRLGQLADRLRALQDRLVEEEEGEVSILAVMEPPEGWGNG